MKKSFCCNVRLIGGVQCESCGANGLKEKKKLVADEGKSNQSLGD